MGKLIQIEVPDEVGILIDKDPAMKIVIKNLVREEIVRYVMLMLTMDKLTEDSKLTEQDILELDKRIKEGIVKRLENELNR